MKRLLLFLCSACILISATSLHAKSLSKVAAIVNNEIVTTHQLDKAVLDALSKTENSNHLTSEQFDQLKNKVLNKLIDDKLVEQRIKELGLMVSDAELNSAIEDVRLKNKMSSEDLLKALEARGKTLEDYRKQIKEEILRYKLLNREVKYKVEVNSSEIRKYFRDHIDEYRVKPKVRVSSLSYSIPADSGEKEQAELLAKANQARDQLLAGESFDSVLASQGEDTYGGDMGELVEDDLTPELRDALSGLAVGQVTEPVRMGNQLHLFLVTGRTAGDSNLYDRVKGKIEKILMKEKTEARFKEWTQELHNRSYIDIRI